MSLQFQEALGQKYKTTRQNLQVNNIASSLMSSMSANLVKQQQKARLYRRQTAICKLLNNQNNKMQPKMQILINNLLILTALFVASTSHCTFAYDSSQLLSSVPMITTTSTTTTVTPTANSFREVASGAHSTTINQLLSTSSSNQIEARENKQFASSNNINNAQQQLFHAATATTTSGNLLASSSSTTTLQTMSSVPLFSPGHLQHAPSTISRGPLNSSPAPAKHMQYYQNGANMEQEIVANNNGQQYEETNYKLLHNNNNNNINRKLLHQEQQQQQPLTFATSTKGL